MADVKVELQYQIDLLEPEDHGRDICCAALARIQELEDGPAERGMTTAATMQSLQMLHYWCVTHEAVAQMYSDWHVDCLRDAIVGDKSEEHELVLLWRE